MAKYNIGIWNRRTTEQWVFSCICGTVGLRENKPSDYKCEGCGNTNFLSVNRGGRILHPYLDVLEKSAKGFKVKRTNLSVMVDKEYNVTLKPNMVKVLDYNLADSKVRLWKNGEEVDLNYPSYKKIYEQSEYQRFFTGIDSVEFKDMVSVAQTESLYNMAWTELSRGTGRSWERRIYRGFIKVFDHVYLQILSNAGYPNVQRFKVGDRYYGRNNPKINTNGKTPKDIFGLPKFCLKYIREDESIKTFEIGQMQDALRKVDGNRFRELLEIVKDESSIRDLCNSLDTLIEIHDTYKYNNIKKLTLYLFREIRMTQGITSPSNGATLLRDYIKMCTKLKQEYEKYPKSLKKEHDIVQMNYKVQENAIKQREFMEIVTSDEYKQLEYKDKEYVIVSPNEMQDLIKEGSELSHCVASYVEAITSKRCNIYFLRKVNEIDKPYATIEVRGSNVRQARGYANRALRDSEREFLVKWTKKKELEQNYYY